MAAHSRPIVLGFLLMVLLAGSGFSRISHALALDGGSGFSQISRSSSDVPPTPHTTPTERHDDGVWEAALRVVTLSGSCRRRSKLQALHGGIVPTAARATARDRQLSSHRADRPHTPASLYSIPLLI
jgi:hypothetical protein